MKQKFYFLILALLSLNFVKAQMANVTYQARTTSITSWADNSSYSCWESDGLQEWTGYAGSYDNINGAATSTGCQTCDVVGTCTYAANINLQNRTNTADILFGTLDAWEDDCGTRCNYESSCGFFNEDDCRSVLTNSYNFRIQGLPTNSSTFTNGPTWGSNFQHQYTLGCSWRYTGTNNLITPSCAVLTSNYSAGSVRSWSVNLTAGVTYNFNTCASVTSHDSRIRIYASDGFTQVVEDDDSCGVLSSINYTPTTSGTYYIEVSQFNRLNGLVSSGILSYSIVSPTLSTNSGNKTICRNGTSTSLGGSTPVSGTGTWTASSTDVVFSNVNSPTATATSNTAGTYTLTWTINNGSCTSSSNLTLTVQDLTPIPSVTTPINYIQGSSAVPLTAIGNGLLWYTTASGGIGSTSAPIPNTTTIGTTSYWVTATNTNSCESARVEIIVTVSLSATHLNFDGVDDLVNCGTSLNTVLDPLNTITVEAWVRPSTNTGLGVIVGNYANSNQSSMQFLLRRENNNYGFWIQGTGAFKTVSANNSVVLNTWQHVVGVWNGSDLRIYINGVLAGTTTGVTDSSFASTTNSMIIGNNQFSGNPEEFTGSIDEVRIWSTVRTIEQLNGSKNCELQGTESGLLAYYNFNQGIDQANNSAVTTLTATTGPNGTLTNFALNGSVSNWLAGSPVTTGSIVPSVATVTTPVVYIQGATATALTASTGANGTGLLWYTTATGGVGSATAPTPSTATVGNTSYWVSSTNANGCESARVEIVVTVNTPISATHLNFDGTNDFINLSASSINDASQGTIEAWIYPTATVLDNQTICSKQSNFENSYSILTLGGSTAPNGRLFYQSKNGASIISTATLTANQWIHVAVTFNSTQAKIYINGVLDNTVSGDFSLPNDTSVTATSIGAWLGDGGGQYFKGNIDEFRFWNTLRTAEQIFGSKNCELQGTENGLVTYYKFNQGFDQANNSAVTTLTATTGPNATLTNFALNSSVSNWLAGSPVTTGSIIPSVATVATPVVYTQGDIASALGATTGTNGTGLLWYTSATGGVGLATAPTPSTSTVGNTSYWVSSTNANGCESARVEIVVTVNAPLPATHLNFDGVDDVVNLGNSLTTFFTGKTQVTIQAWVRSETTSGLGHIVGNYNYPTNINAMQMMLRREGSNYAFWLDSGSGLYSSTTAVGSVVLNTWQHITGTWDGTTMRIYINGVLANSSAKTGTIPSKTTSFSIGANDGERFDGDIDEVRLWDKALSASDIVSLKDCELQSGETGLVAYYKLNQGLDNFNNSTVTSATDSSGNAYIGTLTNFALTGITSNWKVGSTVTTGNTCAILGNSDFENVNSITIYPNPSTGIFNIVSQQVITIEIYDLLGKLVYNQQLVSGANSIDISNLNTGVYLLKATDLNGNSQSHKLIKN